MRLMAIESACAGCAWDLEGENEVNKEYARRVLGARAPRQAVQKLPTGQTPM